MSSGSDKRKKAVRHPLEQISPPISPTPVLRRASSPSAMANGSSSSSSPHSSTPGSTPSPSNLNHNNRHSVIGNLNNWISDSLQNLSSSPLFGNLSLSNPFSRRNKASKNNSPNSPLPSPLVVPRSKSQSLSSTTSSKPKQQFSLDLPPTTEEKAEAKFLIGTLVPTLKPKELIELASIGMVEVDTTEKGVGHHFQPHQLVNPTWCDSCGDFMWTPATYENCVNGNVHFQSVQCDNCKYICHVRCRKLVRIDCQGTTDSGTLLKPPSTDDQRPPSPLFIETSVLLEKMAKFNGRLKNKGSGLGMSLCEDGTFRGFLRIAVNLTRPINVVAGTRPPSIYDIIKEDEEAALASRRTLTSFYMPRDTVKNIHITSESTSLEVIKSMLKKFKVIDNPQKFALYQSYPSEEGDKVTGTLLKRISDQDKPLRIALDWLDSDDKKFVLQENDTADINWDAFAQPELQNFLRILEREEKEHVNLIKDRYMWLKNEMKIILNVKVIQSEGVVV